MKATLNTTHKATFRSLTADVVEVNENRNQQAIRLNLLIVWMFCVLAFLFIGQLSGQLRAAEKGTADPLYQDRLRFVGPAAANVASSPDSYMISLKRHADDAVPYGILVYGIDPVERALLQDAQDAKWDNFDLFRAALIVEGLRDPNKIREYEARLDKIVAAALAKYDSANAPEALTRELFESMHREILTQPYDIDCTAVGKVLETGHFNCVSATVLFNCLAYKAGLDVYALEMPGHALSRVKFNGKSMNLETTCPTWFELQDETAKRNATLQRIAPAPGNTFPATGSPSAVPATPNSAAELDDLSKKLREISPVQLIATIYYNLGVDLHAEKRYADAAIANIKALYLDSESETAWGNFMAAINNWAIELTTEKSPKRYDLAAVLLDQGVYLDPSYDKFHANQLHVYYFWIRDLAVEGRLDDAKTVFALADQRLPGNKDIASLMQAIGKR